MASTAPPRKANFANGALRFVSGTRLRAMTMLTLAVALAATLAGAFGTHAVPWPQRALFWLVLLGWNQLKWEIVVRWLRKRGWGYVAITLAGTLVMLASLPFEIAAALRLLTDLIPAPIGQTFLRVAGLALVALLAMLALSPWLIGGGSRQAEPVMPLVEARFANTAILLRDIAALIAEDHYVRIHLADGNDRLIHGRLRDAIAGMGEVPGAEVRRGAWIAEAHRGEARREGEGWVIAAGAKLSVAVSRRHAARLRELGWIGKPNLKRA